MLKELLKRSVIMRLGFVLSAIVLLAWAGMTGALFIAARADGEAEAVNVAGQLRMQSYRIATYLLSLEAGLPVRDDSALPSLVAGFERRLRHTALAGEGAVQGESRDLYRRVRQRWREEVRPILFSLIPHLEARGPEQTPLSPEAARLVARYLALLPGFVDDIDHAVKALELDAQQRVHMLWLLEAIPLGLTLAIVLLVLHLSYKRLLAPLHRLLACAEGLQKGDLTLRADFRGNDEFALIGRTLNALSEDLLRLYRDLEGRVETKTRELRQRTASLELLYRTVRRLNETSEPHRTFSVLVEDLAGALGARGGLICLHGDREVVTGARPTGTGSLRHFCPWHSCSACRAEEETRVRDVRDAEGRPYRLFSVPIRDQSRVFGMLVLDLDAGAEPQPWERELAVAVAGHVGIAIRMQQRHDAEQRLALLGERSVIARELHDSLAQSLTYLKIKALRLEADLDTQPPARLAGLVAEIKTGLADAYRELRSLLNTFRLRIDDKGLEGALATAVAEQAKLSSIEMTLDFRLEQDELDAHEQVHVLHIVREALSNVARHSGAKRAHVALERNADGQIVVTIEDDGKGVEQATPGEGHHGLQIMRERAEELGGTLHVGPASRDGGLRVELRFRPRCAHSEAMEATA